MSFEIPHLPLQQPGLLLAVLTAAILLAPILARRLRLPEVVAVVVVGFAIGPTGLGLVERAGVVEVLGNVGLLYLMFVAGLELDLDDFIEHRRDSIGFGALTFVVPMALGTVSSLALGYDLLAAILLASCWASHTLVTYPAFQRVGTVGNRAVATSVGATIITDTAALLVLAVVARAHQGALTPVFWLTLLPSMAILTAGAVLGLPRAARWFFSGRGQDRSLRFLFVMVALFTVASLAEVIGIEAIVGAFLAGLALNRSVPNGGALMERIDFLGATLFIPLFLLATGMLIDIQVLLERRTLLIGGVFTVVALVAKFVAAWISGKALRYTWPEIGAMFALSAAQAAATLAAIVVGLNVGLIDEDTVNAVMMVIVVTCLVAPAVAGRAAPLLPRPEVARDLGEVVVVPLANPATAPRLMRVASAFARADGGLVVPLMVVPSETDRERLREVRELDAEVVAVAQSAGAEARSVLRIDVSTDAGIAHTVVEQQASLLVMGWKGGTDRHGALFGGVIDRVLSRSFLPMLLVREGTERVQRVLVVVDDSISSPAGGPALELALESARLLAREAGGVPVAVVSQEADGRVDRRVREHLDVEVAHDGRRRSIVVKALARPEDLIVVPTIADEPNLTSVAARIARAAPEGASLIVAVDNSPVAPGRIVPNDEEAVAVGEAGRTAHSTAPITEPGTDADA
ncbi:cation:proton antiporter [Egicoccus sp. AB-alg2]|uniref:cation:proton antiporter domain-containing protein n=1 Tax=Egicoccus sp. AB-alg2 TaxID=3242693 RepID=UPI00359DC25D